jgi:hypothetical protein
MKHRRKKRRGGALRRRYGRFGGQSMAGIEAQAARDVAAARRRGLTGIDDLYLEFAINRDYTAQQLTAWTNAARAELRGRRVA